MSSRLSVLVIMKRQITNSKCTRKKRWFRRMLRQDSTSCNCLEIPEDASTLLSGFKIDQRKPKIFNLKQKPSVQHCSWNVIDVISQLKRKKKLLKSNKAKWVFLYFCMSNINILVMITITIWLIYVYQSSSSFILGANIVCWHFAFKDV